MATADLLADEIALALGLPRGGWSRRVLCLVFGRAIRRLADIGETFDRGCAERGLPSAAEEALANWCQGVEARGCETVPAHGPLLVMSNHPGTYDALVIASKAGRDDLSIIVSDIPFLMALPAACKHFILMSMDQPVRMTAARQAIRHLRSGGSVLVYGSGRIDADPALSTAAWAELGNWYRSIELFLACVPEAKILPCIVSHAVSPFWSRSPHRWLRRGQLEQRRLVEFAQVIQQLLWPGSLVLSPRLSFGEPVCAQELEAAAGADGLLEGMIAAERQLMTQHVLAFGGPRQTR